MTQATALSLAMLDKMIAAIPAVAMPRLASNEWVVAGSRTASGKPILANDPHLTLDVPVLWYLASITAPDLDVTGVTVPGVPPWCWAITAASPGA